MDKDRPTGLTEDAAPKRQRDYEAALDSAIARWLRVATAIAVLLLGMAMIIHGYDQEQHKLNTVALCVK